MMNIKEVEDAGKKHQKEHPEMYGGGAGVPNCSTEEKPKLKRRLSVSYSEPTDKSTTVNSNKRKRAEDDMDQEDSTSDSDTEDLTSADGMCKDNNCMICYNTERWEQRDHMIEVYFHKARAMQDGWTIMHYLPDILIPYGSIDAFIRTERSTNKTMHISLFTNHISVYHY